MTKNNYKSDQSVFDRFQSTGRINHALRKLMSQHWNKCSACSASIPNSRPAFAGYDTRTSPIYVGLCCAYLLTELATPVYWSDTINISIPDKFTVWRYIDFPKYVAMLEQRGLYLPRADQMGDPFEGAAGQMDRKTTWDNHYLEYFRNSIRNPPPGSKPQVLKEAVVEAQAQKLLNDIKEIGTSVRKQFISCWHQNDVESEAQWRLYCPPGVAGLAIKSNVRNLWKVCEQHKTGIVGKVEYVNFERSFATLQNQRIFQKRKSLRHEREVRIVCEHDPKKKALGKILECDLEALITKVVVSPFAPTWLIKTVESVTNQYGFSLDICESDLLKAPFF